MRAGVWSAFVKDWSGVGIVLVDFDVQKMGLFE